MAIQMRRGPLAKYDKNKMLAGEWGISIDADTNDQKAMIVFAPGVDKEVMFVEDAAEQIAEATAEAIDIATEEAEAWAHGNSFHVNDYASGDGSTRSFLLAQTPSSILGVYVDGAAVTAYTQSGKTITFTTAPAAGQNNIRVYYTVNTATDNSKYYKESASSYASQAANSMNMADQAAGAAFEQAQSASTAAATATTKAGEAAISAQEAATSATNASSSATAASTSAGQAADSATAASGSATAAADSAEDAQEMSYAAEAWAVGTKGGTDVPSTDPQYHNNAKYYTEQAEAAASQSAAQASIAEVYDATTAYAIGDYCLHDGQLYECTTEITTPEAWTAAHWTATTVGTELNEINDDVTDLKEDLDNVRERTDNLVDCNSASKWIAASGKDVTVTIPDEDTVRIKSNISQTYAAARYEINTHGVNTLYTAIGAYSGDGNARARLYGSTSGTITNLGTINVSGNVFDVSAYDICIVELCATVATASDGYIDYSRVIVASSDIAVEYQPYYVYKADEAISKLSYVENVAKTAAEAAGTPPGKFYAIHRGARSTAPENTMPAFIRARQLGYKIIETDVRYTSDMVPVLIHDGTINRTARNADGTDLSETINIADITYEQALAYDFGIFKGQEYAGTKIPTLSEFLHWCKATGVTPVIEQKIRNNSEIDLVIDAIIEAGMETNFVSLSQTVGSLSRIYNRLPNGKFVLLNNSTITQEIIDSVSASIFIESIAGLYTSYTPELIESCKTANVALYAHDYYKYTDIYATDDYVSGYIIEEGAI